MVGKPAVQVIIAGDTKGLEKSLKSSSSAIGSFGRTAAGVFGGLAIAKGVELLADGVKTLGNFALEGVGKLDELGDSTARLNAMVKGLGDQADDLDLTRFGVDKSEATASALAIAKVGKNLGLTGDQLRKVSPELQTMAAQLASLGDGDPAAQAELLAKALTGNAKAAKALGIALPEGATGMKAYRSVMEQLGPQLDKATSGQASLADVGERWDAVLANLQLQLAGFLEKLAPVVSTLLDVLLPVLKDLVDNVGPMVADLFAGISDALAGFLESGGAQGVADIFATIAKVLSRIATFVMENVVPAFLELAGAIAKELGPIFDALAETIDALMPVLEQVWGFVGDVVVPLLTKYVIPLLGKLLTGFLDIVKAVAGPLASALKGLGDLFGKLLDWAKPVLDMLGRLGDVAGDVIGAVGGVIPWSSGAGAPAGRAGGAPVGLAAGATITVNVGVGDPVAIGRAVARYLGSYTARGGSLA